LRGAYVRPFLDPRTNLSPLSLQLINKAVQKSVQIKPPNRPCIFIFSGFVYFRPDSQQSKTGKTGRCSECNFHSYEARSSEVPFSPHIRLLWPLELLIKGDPPPPPFPSKHLPSNHIRTTDVKHDPPPPLPDTKHPHPIFTRSHDAACTMQHPRLGAGMLPRPS
jgi:hypothetical protein